MKHGRIKGALALAVATAVAIAGLSVLAPAVSALTSDEIQAKISALEAQLSEVESEKKAAQSNYDSVVSQKKEQMKVKEALDAEINALERQISLTNQMIAELTAQIEQKQAEADELQAQMDYKLDKFKQRIRTSYEQGTSSVLELIFTSEDFTTMLTNMDIVEAILQYDKDLIETIRASKAEIVAVKEEIEADKAAQETRKAELSEAQSSVNAKLREADKVISDLESNQDEYEAALAKIAEEEEALDAAIKKQLAELASISGDYVGGEFIWPIPGYKTVTSPYGMRLHPTLKVYKLHTGTDIGAPRGTRIVAMNSGTIITSTYSSSYGNYVIIDHGGGRATLYAHMMSASPLSVGQKVAQGETVGYVGSTGYSTGNHLHFEVRINGSTVDPMSYFS